MNIEDFTKLEKEKRIQLLTKDRLSKLLKRGYKAKEIAAAFSCSLEAVYKRLAQTGICLKEEVFDSSPTKNEIIAYFSSGGLMKNVSKELGCDRRTIYRRFTKYRFNQYMFPYISEKQLKEFFYSQHLSSKDIASKLGCRLKTIQYYMKMYKLKPESLGVRNAWKRAGAKMDRNKGLLVY
jgi:hypothetical protein